MKWYRKHLTTGLNRNVPNIVLLTNDQANLGKAKEEGITACSSPYQVLFFG
jgi:hypothetical protein